MLAYQLHIIMKDYIATPLNYVLKLFVLSMYKYYLRYKRSFLLCSEQMASHKNDKNLVAGYVSECEAEKVSKCMTFVYLTIDQR